MIRFAYLPFIALLVACGGSSPATDAELPDGGLDAEPDVAPDTLMDGEPPPECVAAADCTLAEEPICRRSECSGCLTDVDCSEGPGLAVCHDDGSCAECSRDTDCDAGFCLPVGVCAACRTSDDCPVTGPLCSAGACVSCTAGAGCSGEMLRDEWMAALCEVVVTIEAELDGLESMEAAICSARFDVFPTFAAFADAIDGGDLEVTGEGLAACRAAAGSTDAFDVCSAALAPRVVPGGDCFSDDVCVSGRCDLSGTCPGVCVADPGDGEACVGGRCGDDLTCIAATCRPTPGDGEACAGRCADGLTCNITTDLCEARRGLGGSCFSGAECDVALRCIGGACSTPAAGGAACRGAFGSSDCAAGLRCVGDVCRLPKDDGEACAGPRECGLGSRCHDSVCRRVLLPGGECEPGGPCAFGTACALGRCRPAPDIGESCEDSGSCLRGACEGTTCQNAASFSTCEGGRFLLDALDPCGSVSTCLDTPSGFQCIPEGNVSADCTGVIPCRAPDLQCNGAGLCEAICAP